MATEVITAMVWVNFITCVFLSFLVLNYMNMVKNYNAYLSDFIRKLVSLEIDVSKLLVKQMEESLRISRDINIEMKENANGKVYKDQDSKVSREKSVGNWVGMEKSPLLSAVDAELTRVEKLV